MKPLYTIASLALLLLLTNKCQAQNFVKQDSLVNEWIRTIKKNAKTAFDTSWAEDQISDSVIKIIISRRSNCWANPDSSLIFFVDDTDGIKAKAFSERQRKKKGK